MGIQEIKRKFSSGTKIRDFCEKNRDTGEVECKRVRVQEDGSEQDLAGFTMETDGNCSPMASREYDNEEGGHLDSLEKKFVSKFVGNCKKNIPGDY